MTEIDPTKRPTYDVIKQQMREAMEGAAVYDEGIDAQWVFLGSAVDIATDQAMALIAAAREGESEPKRDYTMVDVAWAAMTHQELPPLADARRDASRRRSRGTDPLFADPREGGA